MAYAIYDQYLNQKTGYHVIELRDEAKNQHFVQIAVGFDSCPACGHVTPTNNLGEIDPKALVAEVIANLNKSNQAQSAYARKHGLKAK